MALSGWLKKCQITIAANQLPQTQTNQVVILNSNHFPTGMLTLGGADACKSDGSDIRFSTDTNGDTLIPFDIIRISLNATPANSVLVVAFKTNVTANTSFSVWCHWGNPSANLLAATDTNGAGNCWSEIYGILYLQEDPGTVSTATAQWKFFKEATGRYSAASEIGACQRVSGPISGLNAIAINASNGIRVPEVISTGPSDTFTVAAFIRPAGTTYPGSVPTNDYSGAVFFSGASEMLIGWDTAGQCKWQYAGGYANPQFGIGKGDRWRLWVTQVSGTSATYYLDPTLASFSVGSITSLTNLQYLGGADTGGTVKAGAYHICMFMIGKFALPNINYFRNLQKNFDNISTLATAGSIQSSSVSATLTLTGLIDGTEVRVYNGSTEVAGVESSTGGTFTYNYSSAFTATIVIHNLLEQYIRFGSVSLTTSGATIPIQQIDDLWYKGTIPSNLNSTNITVSSAANTIQINNGIKCTLQDLYSYLKNLWKSDATLISRPFPFVPITDEQYILNDPWNFANSTTINSILDGGWSRRDASNNILEEYVNLSTLGSFTGTAYYTQVSTDTAASTTAINTGAMDQAIKVFGNAANGNFDRRNYMKVFIRNLGFTFQEYDLLAEQQLSALTFKKYAAPLSNITDTKIITTNTTTLNSAPYNTVTVTRYTENIRGNWVASTSYAVGDVVKNPSNRWVRCSTAHTSAASYSGANWAAFNGERLIDGVYYAFRFIINGGGLTLQQIYSRTQYLLTLSSNVINTGTALNGVVAPRFTSYLGDIMQTFNGVFIDNFASADINKVEFYDYAGTKAVFPLTVTFSLTGLQSGTEVRIYRTSDMVELGGVESSTTSFSYAYTYSSDIPVTIVVHVETYNYISFTTTLTNQSTSVPIQQFSDLWYSASIPSNVNSTNVVINAGTNPKTIQINTAMNMRDLYSYLKQLWKSSTTLIKEPFPITAITDEQFIINNPWNFLDASSVNNIRNAGWSRRNGSGVVLEEYMNVTTLGTFTGTANYTNLTSYSAAAPTNAIASGPMNQPVKIYGDASNGNLDLRSSTDFIIRIRNIGYTYSEYNLIKDQQLSGFTFKKYTVPLSNTLNTKSAETNLTTLNTTPYTNVEFIWLNNNLRGSWVASTAYTAGDVVKNPSNRWVRCTASHTSGASYSGTNWTTFEGERLVNGVYYAFQHIINANNERLQVVYDRFQRNMQHGFQINTTGNYMRGTLSPIFFEYIGDVLSTNTGVFIDNVNSLDINFIQFRSWDGVLAKYPLTLTFSLTGLQTGTEVRIYRTSDMLELGGIENSSSTFTYTYEYSTDIAVTVVIHNESYEYISINTTLTNQSTSIPIQQRFDRNDNLP